MSTPADTAAYATGAGASALAAIAYWWWKRRKRRDRAPRAYGAKSRARIAELVRKAREVTGQERWAYGLAEPVRKRPVLSLTVGAVVGGFGLGFVIGWAKTKAQR